MDFESLEWREMAPGARHKVAERAGKRIRLVEFTDAFVEKDWCGKGHVGYILEGEMEIAFEGRTERLRAGDGVILQAGEKHKARALGPSVRFLLVEDA